MHDHAHDRLPGPVFLELRRLTTRPAGMEYAGVMVLKSLADQFPQQPFVVLSQAEQPAATGDCENLWWVTMPVSFSFDPAGRAFKRPFSFVFSPLRKVSWAFQAWYRSRGACIYHGLLGEVPVVGLPGVNRVITINDLVPLKMPEVSVAETRLVIGMGIRQARSCDGVIVPSMATRSDLIDFAHVDAERITVVPYGVNPAYGGARAGDGEVWARVRSRFRLSKRPFLFVGTIEPRKNLVRLVSAFGRLPCEETLVLAGQWGWMADDVRAAIEASPAGDRIVVTGYLPEDELRVLMANARAMVYVSLLEGFGLPLLEAMSMGAPVIASGTSSLPEVVGDAGILVDPLDEDAIFGAIARLARDDEACREYSERGRTRASHFTWARCARETFAVYRRLVGL